MECLIKVENLTKEYMIGENKVMAIDDISFEINSGEFVVILGPSGCGKSSLLNILGGIDTASGGSAVVSQKKISEFSEKELDKYRREDVGFIFQTYNLMPNLTVRENVELSHRLCKSSVNTDEILETVGLADRKNHFPAELSGGEQQRTSIARAISKNPKLLLCDEPTGALDSVTGKKILCSLWEMCRSKKQTVIIVTHNSAIADAADKVIQLSNGKILKITSNPNPISLESINW